MTGADPRVAQAHQQDIEGLLGHLRIEGLTRVAGELVGPCPGPGCGGRDRFAVNIRKQVFNCRVCGAKGDQIALVQLVLGLDFPAALDWLCGPAPELTPEQRAEIAAREDRARAEREAQAARYRAAAVHTARRIWDAARPAEGSIVADYLGRRGLPPRPGARLPRVLAFEPSARLVVPRPGSGRDFVTVHEGPTMLAAIQGPDDRLMAVHRTWIDLSQPKGRPVIAHPFKDGERVPAKKVYGAKKGGAIRLFTPRGADTLVMGEGIETTLTALRAPLDGAAYWAGVDLGNMGGQRRMGQGLKFAGIPDMDDREAFVPPAWVRRLVFIQDGDSDPQSTRARLLAGLRRAMALRPGLRGQIVHAGEGRDLNDIIMEGAEDA